MGQYNPAELAEVQHDIFKLSTRNLSSLCNSWTVVWVEPDHEWGSELNQSVSVILVIEDDEALQMQVEDALSEGGFEAAIAASGEEAVTLLIGQKTNYRALVKNINLLGRLDGWEVAQKAREIDPEFPIVYMSGAAAADWSSKGVPNGIMLEKPFAPAQLLTAVASLLNSGTPLP